MSISDIFNKIQVGIDTATKIVPAVSQLVQSIEKTVAETGSTGGGSVKKEAVLAIIKAVLETVGDEAKALFPDSALTGLISKVIDVVVGLLNGLGVFKKSATS